ncbi:MAG TPA: TraC family protein [Oligoflexia bacterium]|nr:TraC family protein [Oligoflexia bacterium]HMP27732.1 TraC family protein [Oligoflexia bacterium]
MSIDRLTRERLYQDESLFNELLPFAKYDPEYQIFIHSDASLWAMFELQPLWIIKISDAEAFQVTEQMQELLDSLDETISCQLSWITTFDVQDIINRSQNSFPLRGPAGWMTRRWLKFMSKSAQGSTIAARPRKLRLVMAFRFQPKWKGISTFQQIVHSVKLLLGKSIGFTVEQRAAEYREYANRFKGLIDGKAAKLADLGFAPRRLDGQAIINLLYPLLNRKSVRVGKFRSGRNASVPVPVYDPDDLLANQISETPLTHPQNGIIKKDGRIYRTVSMVKPPKVLLPLMITPLQASPHENILTVTFSKDDRETQLKRLDKLDSLMGFREFTARGRSNQKVQHQIAAIRAARNDLYNSTAQIVRVGVHQTFICQNVDEAIRASSEAVAAFPQLNGARGMVHEISDLGVMINSLPGCYDPSTDGAGWTNVLRSSRATRLFPLWGNWKGTNNPLILLPSLWNRELVGFDLYDSNIAPNVLISGVSGAGKSYLLCYLITMLNRGHFAPTPDGRFQERPPITFIFDKGMIGQPCGFDKLARLFGGRIYEATPSKAPAMNFLARLGETPADNKNEDYKDLLDMCADIIGDMASDAISAPDRLQRASIIESLIEAHFVYRNGPMRREFILSDVVSVLRAPKRVDENDESAVRRQRIATLLSDYYGEGTYARFFDRPGSLKLKERFIVFDLKALSRNPDLQRVFLKVAMLWADSVMNDSNELDCRKVLVFDEAHDLIGKTSVNTIETAFRLYRKRKGIVIAASQSGEDFYVGAGGQAIVQNSAHKIFLRQDPNKFHLTAQAFNLNDQQAGVIMRLRTVKGMESQFYLISDIGEAALVLPLESAFYWISTNNGDDNQLFSELLEQAQGDLGLALQRAIKIAPYGATALRVPQGELQNSDVENGSFESEDLM